MRRLTAIVLIVCLQASAGLWAMEVATYGLGEGRTAAVQAGHGPDGPCCLYGFVSHCDHAGAHVTGLPGHGPGTPPEAGCAPRAVAAARPQTLTHPPRGRPPRA